MVFQLPNEQSNAVLKRRAISTQPQFQGLLNTLFNRVRLKRLLDCVVGLERGVYHPSSD
jgi:hypothetical protein